MTGDPAATEQVLLRAEIRAESDVFALRHSGRAAAAAFGLDTSDQVRVATALSEVGRVLVSQSGSGGPVGRDGPVGPVTAVFRVGVLDGADTLEVELVCLGELPLLAETSRQSRSEGLAGATRLVDALRVDIAAGRTSVVLVKRLAAVPRPAGWIATARAQLMALGPTTPSDELWRQNQDLLTALEESQRSRDAQRRMNEELEETNRGVMALYLELTEELDHTNQGVVALYAELDDRSQQLRATNEAKTRFLRHVNHELRAPVTSILGLVRLLAEATDPPLGTEQRRQVEFVSGSANDLLTLINGLLDLAKAESGGWEPEWEPVDLRAVLAQLRGTLRALSSRPDVELVIVDPDPPPALVSDGRMLTHILRNLLTNGLNFTQAGTVGLDMDVDADHIRLVVADTGIGIPADHHDRVFEEFHQVPGPLQAQVNGTGLGLPLVRSLVSMLGGTITLESEPGRGTTVAVTLPRRPPQPTAGPQTSSPGSTRAADPLRIFVVDDDEPFRHLLRSLLEDVGCGVVDPADRGSVGEIIDVADARQTTALMLRLRPHLVFLGLRMPELTGDEVIATIRADPRLRSTPVTIVTAEPTTMTHSYPTVLSKATVDAAGVAAAVRAAVARENGSRV